MIFSFTILLIQFFIADHGMRIECSNMLPAESHVRVAIYTQAATFLEDNGVKYYHEQKVNGEQKTELILKDLPYGTYALAIYQDLNHNKKLDVNLVGYPSEPFGFSNNIRPRFKAPSFADCKFDYSATQGLIKIKLIR
jgi:uncharacterized protein (DUF2141 family)